MASGNQRSRDHFLPIRGQYPGVVAGVMTNKRPVFRSRPRDGKLVVLPEARPVLRQRQPTIGTIVVLPEARKFFGNQMRFGRKFFSNSVGPT